MEPKHCRVASTNRQFQQLIVAEHGPHVRYELIQFLFSFWHRHSHSPVLASSILVCRASFSPRPAFCQSLPNLHLPIPPAPTTTHPAGEVLANHLPDINRQRIRRQIESKQPQILHESRQHSLCQHHFIAVASVNCRAETL
jgi:hypothetical protein